MAKFIKGNNVANATSYSLYEKKDGSYNLLKTKNSIDFQIGANNDLTGLSLQFTESLVGFDKSFDYDIIFNSGGDDYVKLVFEAETGLTYVGVDGSYDQVYSILDGAGTWSHNDYKTINIAGGDDCKNSNAITDLTAMTNLNTEVIRFEAGEHVLVVKASASGYEDSDYSNEVLYNEQSVMNIKSLPNTVLHDNSLYNYDTSTTPPTYTFREDTDKVYYCFDFIPVKANTQYRIQYGRSAFFVDNENKVIGVRVNFTSGYTDWTFTTPENCAYISVSLKYSEVLPENALIELK